MKDTGRSNTAGIGSQRLRGALVVSEVALAVVLLVGAGLFVGSFVRLVSIDPGFDYKNVLTFYVSPAMQPGKFQEAIKASRTYVPQMQEAVRERPRRGHGRNRRRWTAAHRQLEPHECRDPRPGRVEGG